MTDTIEESWYIVQQPSKQCDVVSAAALDAITATESDASPEESTEPAEKWGPFKTQNQAIAKRVGLIRAGKCQPS